MKKLNTLNLVLLLVIIASVSAIALQEHLPQKTLSVVPRSDSLNTFLYMSKPEGSTTHAAFLDQENHQWRCISEAVDDWLVCSFSMLLAEDVSKGWDLRSYSTLNIKVNYNGPATKMRVVLRNFDPRFSTLDDANSSKFQFIVLRQEDFNKTVSINLSEFTVSDWWIEQFDLPRHLSRPDVSNVVYLGVELVEGLPPGHHDVTLEEFSFTGDLISPEQWYLGILVAWILACLGVVGVRMFRLSRQSEEAKQQISELAVTNYQLQTENSRFQTMSNLDALTGVYNRYAIDTNIAQLLANPHNRPIAIIIIDIDHFKRINDRRGHDTGDNILKQFSLIVSSNIRSGDVFGRWGGEEFILICPKTSIDSAFYLAEKIRRITSDTVFEKERPISITASFGVGTLQQGEDFPSAFRRVDAALYHAKALGRNCTIIAETEQP